MDPHYHHRYFRMDKASFDEILHKVFSKISHRGTHIRPISPLERLAITIRYLATGSSQCSLAFSYRISPSSISNIIRETLNSINDELGPIHLPKPSEAIWSQCESDFNKKWNFPNCSGAIDGKHVRIRAPARSVSEFFNYKNFFSIVLLVITNAKYQFTVVDIGSSGSQSDSGIFMRSAIGKRLENGTISLPGPKFVNKKLMPFVIVGDDAFPLRTNLMKPFPGRWLSQEARIFNYRLSRARMVVENSFGILAARWQIFHRY